MKQQLDNILLTGLVSVVWISTCIVSVIGSDGELGWVAVILFGLFTYTSIMLWKTVFDRRVAPLELMFWLFHTNFLLLPALSQSIHRSFYWSPYTEYRQETLLYASFIIIVGLIAFGIGAVLSQRGLKSNGGDNARMHTFCQPLETTWLPKIFLAIIIFGLVILISQLGIEFYTSSRTNKLGQVQSLAEMGLLINLPQAVSLGVLLFSIVLLFHSWRVSRKLNFATMVILLAALGVNAIINYPLSVPRFWVFGFLIGLMWIFFPLRHAVWRAAFVASFTIMQFTVFPLYSQITRDKGAIGFDIDSIRKYLHHGDFDGFQSIVNISLYIQENGFELGRNLISTVLFFVPRTIWNKAEPLGAATASHMGYIYTNLSAPIYGEFYADYGLLSLILGMGILGYGIRRYDIYFNNCTKYKRFGVGVLITGVLAGFLIILLRGSLLAVVPSIATLIGLLFIMGWLAKRSGKWSHIKFYHR